MKPIKVNSLKLDEKSYPSVLRHIAQPPKELFWQGVAPSDWLDLPKVAVVGSRKATTYGQSVTEKMVGELARAGVVIISGLAFGIDAMAHKAALAAGGTTVAVLPTPIQQVYPSVHLNLSRQILDNGGTLISEYPDNHPGYKLNFIARNRIVSGLADILLITEAALKSGSLHTARFALEQGKTVMTVPGSIFSPASEGCNNLIKSGAVPVTSAEDVFFALNIKPGAQKLALEFNGPVEEQQVLSLIRGGTADQEVLALTSGLDGSQIASALTNLELRGHIRPVGAGNWIAA